MAFMCRSLNISNITRDSILTKMDLNSIKDALDHVLKKQKLSYAKTQDVIDKILEEIEIASSQLIKSETQDYTSLLAGLKGKLHEIAPVVQPEVMHRELNSTFSKYPKALDKVFNPDIAIACQDIHFDSHVVNQIIAEHFYRHGLFDVGDSFLRESQEAEIDAAMRSHFLEMYQILESLKCKNLEPALKWVATNSEKLRESGSCLQLRLHRLQFVEILQRGDREEALKYARTHIAPLSENNMTELMKLMGSLCWTGKLEHSPYSELLLPTNWNTIAEELTRQFCNVLGQSYESPLSVTIMAGSQVLPSLLKFTAMMAGKNPEWLSTKHLPVPVELDPELQFHSIFVCPVSKEESTNDNPPMLLPCGHVLCKHSISKMSKNSTRTFKCPYCPTDVDAVHCRQLYF